MPKPESREGGAPIQYFSYKKRAKEPDSRAANERALAAANEQKLNWALQYQRDFGRLPPNYASGTNLPPVERPQYEYEVPSTFGRRRSASDTAASKSAKKKNNLRINEATIAGSKWEGSTHKKATKYLTEREKTDQLSQHVDLVTGMTKQLQADIEAGKVIRASGVVSKGKKNWFQRNIADQFIGDWTGRAFDIVSRPSYSTAAMILKNMGDQNRIVMTDAELAEMAKKNPEGAERVRQEQEKERAAGRVEKGTGRETVETDVGYKQLAHEAGSGFTGKKKADVIGAVAAPINKKLNVQSSDSLVMQILKRAPGIGAGLIAGGVTDPTTYLTVGAVSTARNANKAARGAKDLRLTGEALAAERAAAKAPRAVEDVITAAEEVVHSTPTAMKQQLALPQIASEMPSPTAVGNTSFEIIKDAEHAAHNLRVADQVAEMRSATEGGFKALGNEVRKQAKRVANMQRAINAGRKVEGFEEAANDLLKLHTRYAQAEKIRDVAKATPVESVSAAERRVTKLTRIVAENPANKLAAKQLDKAKQVAEAARIAAIPENAGKILTMMEKIEKGKKFKVSKDVLDAIADAPKNLQDQVIAYMTEKAAQHTKDASALDPVSEVIGAVATKADEPAKRVLSAETIAEANRTIADVNANKTVQEMAQSIVDEAERRGIKLTKGERAAKIARELVGKMEETGVEEAADLATAEKIAAIKEKTGPLISSETKAGLQAESVAEEVLGLSKEIERVLEKDLTKRIYIRFGGKDLGEFAPVAAVLKKTQAGFTFVSAKTGESGLGKGFGKMFQMGAHFPGLTEKLRSAAEQGGIIAHSDFSRRVHNKFRGISHADSVSISRAIEGGYELTGRLEELRQFAKAEIADIFAHQAEWGKYVPGSKVENYLYHYYRRGGRDAAKAFKDDRTALLQAGKKGPTLEAAKAAGLRPIERIEEILVMHHRDYIRDLQRVNFRQSIIDNYGVLTDNIHFAANQGLQKVKSGQLNKPFIEKGKALGGDWYLPPEIHKTFDAMDNMMTIGKNAESQAVLEAFNKATRFFKTSATVANPGNWVNNTIGDFFLNWVDNVRNPLYYKKAYGLLRQGGEKFPETIRMVGNDVDSNKVLELFKTKAPSGGFIRTEGSAIGKNRVVRGIQDAYEFREETVRMAHFISSMEEELGILMRKGHRLDDATLATAGERAADRVAKWNIDYTAITPFERQVRKYAIPFYTFMRKASPLMLEGMITRPGKFSHYIMGKKATEQLLGVPPEAEDGTTWPFWAKQAGMTRLTGGDQPYFMRDPTPVNVMNRLVGGDTNTDVVTNLLNMVNPQFKIPVEMGMRQTIYNQQPIQNWGQYALSQIPSAGIIAKAAGAPLQSKETKTPDRTVAEQILNLFGVPVAQNTFNRQQGELRRREQSYKDVVARFNDALEPKGYTIMASGDTKNGKYYILKNVNTNEQIGRYRDFNVAARAASRLAPGGP